MKKFFIFCCIISSLKGHTQHLSDDEIYDEYVRKNFTEQKISEITDLPKHLKKVIEKSSLDQQTLHVFVSKEFNIYAAYSNYTIGLPEYFFDFTQDEQAVLFAHELSHIKHKDAGVEIYGNLERTLSDFQIANTLLFSLCLAACAYQSKLTPKSLAHILTVAATTNIAALYYYFQKKRIFEIRADREAAQIVGTQSSIDLTKKWILAKKHDSTDLYNRIKYYLEYLGFSDHPTDEERLAMLLEMQTREKLNNDVSK